MAYSVRRASAEEFDRWNRHVASAPQAGPFHRRESLELLAECSESELHPLVAYKGGEAIGLFPLFENRRGPFTTVESPPLSTVSNLGPVLVNPDRLKQRKREKYARRLVAGGLEWVETNVSPGFLNVRTVDGFTDLRPFKEANCRVEPMYTYVVDITPDPDDLLMRFSSDARSNIRDMEETEYYVSEGDRDETDEIVTHLVERHGGERAFEHITSEVVARLEASLEDGRVRTYVCYDPSDELTGGIITIEYGDLVVGWLGGAKRDGGRSINEFLDWHIIRDVHDRGFARYDLNGANVRGISQYKAKFAPTLTPYYQARRTSLSAKVAIRARDGAPSMEEFRQRVAAGTTPW